MLSFHSAQSLRTKHLGVLGLWIGVLAQYSLTQDVSFSLCYAAVSGVRMRGPDRRPLHRILRLCDAFIPFIASLHGAVYRLLPSPFSTIEHDVILTSISGLLCPALSLNIYLKIQTWMSSEEETWRAYPPVRSDWRDLDGEEFRSYYLVRQREVARFLLDLDL